MFTPIDICNLALAQLKVRPITSFNDTSEESRQCKMMYPYALSQVLTMAEWNFCKTQRKLAAIEHELIDAGYVTDFKLNYFKYPVDAVKLIRVNLSKEPFLPPPPPHKHHKKGFGHHLHEMLSKETDELYHHYQPDYDISYLKDDTYHKHKDSDEDIDDYSAEADAEEEQEEEVEEIADEEDTDEEHHHKHHKHHHHMRPRPVPIPVHRILPMPQNDDGYELKSIKLLHQHFFTEVIVTPFRGVEVEYIRYEENPQFWHPMFTEAVVRYLALQLATLLSGKSDAIQEQQQAFTFALRQAQAVNGNDRKKTLHQTSRLLRGCF